MARTRARKLARGLAWTALWLVGLALLAALVLVLWARSESGRRAIVARLLPGLQERLAGTLHIGALEGDLSRTLVLRDVELRDADGEVAVRVARLSVSYDLQGLVSHTLAIDELVLEGAMVHGRSLADGRFNLMALVKPTATPAGAAGRPLDVVIRRVRADLVVRYDPPPAKRWMRPIDGTLRLEASASSVGDRRTIQLDNLAARMTHPVIAKADVSGLFVDGAGGSNLEALHLTVDSEGEQMETLLSALTIRGAWHAEVLAKGPLASMTVEVAVTPPTGNIAVHGNVGVTHTGVTWRGTAAARALDPATLWAGAPHGVLALTGDGDGENARVRVTLARLDADVAGAHAAGHGVLRYEGALTMSTVADVKSRDLSRLASIGLPGFAGDATVHATFAHAGGHSKIDADVEAHRFGAPSTRVDALTARVHARDLEGSAQIQATAIDLGPRLHFDAATVNAELGPRVVGLAVAAKGSTGSDVVVEAHGQRLRREGPFAVDLDLDRVLVALRGEKWETHGPGHFRFDRAGLAARLSLRGSGTQELDLDGRYGANGAVALHATARKLDVRRLALVAQVQRALPQASVDGEVTVSGSAGQPVVALALTGSMAADRALGLGRTDYRVSGHYAKTRIDGTLSVDKLAIERLAPYLPRSLATLKGLVDVKATVAGSPRAPTMTADLDVPRWQWDVLKENRTRLEVRYGAQRLDAKLSSSFAVNATEKAGTVELELFAPIDLSRGTQKLLERLVHTTPITAAVHLRSLDVARLPLARLGLDVPVSAGLVDGDLKLGGTLHEPTLYATFDGRKLTVAGFDKIDLVLHAEYQRSDLELSLTGDVRGTRLVTASAETRLDFHKLIDGERWQDAPLRADAAISSYELSQWKQLHGALTARAKVRGTLAHPEGDLDFAAERLRIGEMRFGRFSGAAHHDPRHSTARFDAEELGGGGALHGSGELLAGNERRISARLRVEQLSLSLSKGGIAGVRELRGKVDGDVTVTGPLARPQLAGSLNVEDGAFALASQPLLYHHLSLALAAANDRIELKRLAVKVGNGGLVASGSARLDGFATPLGLDMSAQATHFPFRLGSFAAFVDGQTQLHGERKDGVLMVTATVNKGLAQLPRLVDGKKPQSLSPMPDLVFTDPAELRRRAVEAAELAEDAPVKASIKAHIPGPFRVRSSELGTDLQGDLDVEVLGEVVRITGTVESTWGRIDLLGRRYEIERVRVSFDGSPNPDPALDIRITRVVDAATVIVRVRGTLKRPQLELSSEPPIYSESQIIGIIVSGDPGSTRISDAATDQKVVGAISGVLVNQIKSQIAPGLPIDVIRIDETDSTSGTSRLEVGKYITESIYLSYVHQFGAPTGIHPVNSNEAQLQYRFKRHYQLETRFGDAGVGAINFYWSLRY